MTSDKLSKLRNLTKKLSSSPMETSTGLRLIFWGTNDDKVYLPRLKSCVGTAQVACRIEKFELMSQLEIMCKEKHTTKVITTSVAMLKKLLNWKERAAPSLDDYAGSFFRHGDIEIVFLPPLAHLMTKAHGQFFITRLISKFVDESKWIKPTDFIYDILTPTNIEDIFASYKEAFAIAVDIETKREDCVITEISYTALFYTPEGNIRSHTSWLEMDSEWAIQWMRKFNWELKASKVLANGKYDAAYLARYNAPMYDWKWDIQHMFHAWLAELPKRLGYLAALFIREAMYWKDLSHTGDREDRIKYSCLDTWGTANVFIAIILEWPQWAKRNYVLEFPLVFPSHLAEMLGIRRDMTRLAKACEEQQAIIDRHQKSLNIMVGADINVSSPKQMKQLLHILGCKDLTSADEKNLNKARFRHPLNSRILGEVIAIRKARKLVSTYLTIGKEFGHEDNYRILAALNPHGTTTSRNASKEHHFWCGLNLQNQPRGKEVKQTYVADPGFYLAEIDLEQAESRDTAYISGDEILIDTVEHSPDFHKANASAFFGVPFDEVTKDLRTLAKPVNHGANYNMGAGVLVETMGEGMVLQAKQLLGLPAMWTLKRVAEFLLQRFHAAYPGISKYYAAIIKEVGLTGMIRSQAIHWDKGTVPEVDEDNFDNHYDISGGAWVRRTFGDPSKSKKSLNEYVAHPPQSLNAQTLNRAYLKVFKEVCMHPEHGKHIKLHPQIHDSILFQYRKGHEYIIEMVKERMEIPVTVRDVHGKVRTFTVPASAKAGIDGKPAKYWSETE